METKLCPKCDANMTFKEGVSKTNNKPYKGWFCDDKENCKNVEWIRDVRSKGSYTPKPQADTSEIVKAINDGFANLADKIAKLSASLEEKKTQ